MADSRTTDYAIPGANVWRRKLGGFAAAYAEFEDSGGGGGWYPIGAPGHHLLYCLHDGDRQVTIQAICDEGFDSEEFALLRASAATLVPATGEPALRQRLPGTRVELDVPREYVWNGAVFEDFDTSASEFVIGFDSSLAAAKLDSFIRQRALPGTTARIVERSNVQVSGHACSLQLYEFDAPPRTRRHRAWFALLQGDSASAAIIATFDPTKPGKGDRLRQAILGASWTPGRPLDPLADEPFRIDVPAGLRPAARLGPVLVLTGDGLFDPDDPQAPLLEIGIHPVSRHHSSPREAEQVVSGRLRGARTEWREETEFWSRRSAAISGADPRGRPVIGELMLKTEHSRSALLLALVPPDRADMLPAMKRTMDAFPW